jgi:hypothetical protein
LLRTDYKQSFPTILVDSSSYKISVIAMTPVRVLPRPRVLNTVYFYEFEDGGLVPVAYAIYE